MLVDVYRVPITRPRGVKVDIVRLRGNRISTVNSGRATLTGAALRALRALGAWGPRGTLNLFSSTRFQPYESTYHLLEALFYTSI